MRCTPTLDERHELHQQAAETVGKYSDLSNGLKVVQILNLAHPNTRIHVSLNDKDVYFDLKLPGYGCPFCGKAMVNLEELAMAVGISSWPNLLGPGNDWVPSSLETYDADRGTWTGRRLIHNYVGPIRCPECNQESMLIVEPFDPHGAFPPGYYVPEKTPTNAAMETRIRENCKFDYTQTSPSMGPTRRGNPLLETEFETECAIADERRRQASKPRRTDRP